MDVFDLVAKLSLNSAEYEEGIDSAKGKAEGFGSTFSSSLQTAAKVGGAAITAATGAVSALTTSAINSFGEYEQLVGGIETLFGDSAQKVISDASGAFQTAGMSMNDYMETSIQSAAALINSLDGDQGRAAELMNMSITDMSDNVNKMGTTMEAVQNAYRGFSRGNFTMLDNLALGFAGTKEGMEELLEKASEISGFEYDISSYSDIVEAIHVVQTEMGITGTTANEASSTIQGSIGAMQAAWSNLVTGLADDNANFGALVDNFVSSALTVGNNIVPVIEQALGGIGQLIEGVAPVLSETLPGLISSVLPGIVEAGVGLLTALIQGIVDNFPLLIDAAGQIIVILAQGLAEALPDLLLAIPDMWLQVQGVLLEILPQLLELGGTMLVNLIDGLLEKLPDLIDSAIELVDNLIDTIFEYLPKIIDAGMQILGAIVEGILENLPKLIEAAGELLMKFLDKALEYLPQLLESGIEFVGQMAEGVIQNLPAIIQSVTNVLNQVITFIMQNLPEFLKKGIEMAQKLSEGILDNLPEIISAITEAVVTLIQTIAENLPEFLQKGIEILVQIAVGLIEAIPQLLAMLPEIFSAIIDAFGSVDWGSIGTALINGIVTGIRNGASAIWTAVQNAASSALSSVKSFLGIASPSKVFRDQVGQWIPAGIAEGIEENDDMIGNALDDTFDFGPQIMGNVNVSGATGSSQVGLIQELLNKLDGMTVVLDSGETVGRLTVPFNTSLGRQLAYDARGI